MVSAGEGGRVCGAIEMARDRRCDVWAAEIKRGLEYGQWADLWSEWQYGSLSRMSISLYGQVKLLI